MFYDIGSITNRNIQILYEYRILREPSDNLTAICRDGKPITISRLNWVLSDRKIEGFESVYVATLTGVQSQSEFVPFLEFHPESDTDWKWIADFIDVEVNDTAVQIYSANSHLKKLPISVYWCYSIRHIDSMLKDILEDLGTLSKEYDKLETDIKNFRDNGSYLKRPVGLIPNLVKIQNTSDETELVDSLYMVMTAESNRLFVNQSQAELNTMEHIFNEAVEFRFSNRNHHVLDSFICPVLIVSGNGDLVLRNIKGQVVVTKWNGTITIIECPEVHLTATKQKNACQIEKLQISRRSTVYLENYIHKIDELELFADSICRHWRANVKKISYIGPGCTYWCCSKVSVPGRVQLDKYSDNSNTVFDFKLHDVIGMFLTEFDNMMIVAQKNLTTRLGNYDPEPMPSMYVPKWIAHYTITSGGSGGGSTPGSGYVLVDPLSSDYYYHPLGDYAQHYIDNDVGSNVFPHSYDENAQHGWGKLDWNCGPDVPVYSMTNGTITSVNCRGFDADGSDSQRGYSVIIRTDRKDSTGNDIYIRYLELAGLGEITANIAGEGLGPRTYYEHSVNNPCEVPVKQGELIGYTNQHYDSSASNLHLDFTYGDNFVGKGNHLGFGSAESVPHVLSTDTLNSAFELRGNAVYCNGTLIGSSDGKVPSTWGGYTHYTVYPDISYLVCLQKPIRLD